MSSSFKYLKRLTNGVILLIIEIPIFIPAVFSILYQKFYINKRIMLSYDNLIKDPLRRSKAKVRLENKNNVMIFSGTSNQNLSQGYCN